MWEQVFRDDESSVVAMFDMLKKKKDVKLGSPLEVYMLLFLMHCTCMCNKLYAMPV